MHWGSVGAARKVSPNWSQETMTCHSSSCFSIVWGKGNVQLVTSLRSSFYTLFNNFPTSLQPAVYELNKSSHWLCLFLFRSFAVRDRCKGTFPFFSGV